MTLALHMHRDINILGVGECNTPEYTLVVFDMFRVFCRHKLNFS